MEPRLRAELGGVRAHTMSVSISVIARLYRALRTTSSFSSALASSAACFASAAA